MLRIRGLHRHYQKFAWKGWKRCSGFGREAERRSQCCHQQIEQSMILMMTTRIQSITHCAELALIDTSINLFDEKFYTSAMKTSAKWTNILSKNPFLRTLVQRKTFHNIMGPTDANHKEVSLWLWILTEWRKKIKKDNIWKLTN